MLWVWDEVKNKRNMRLHGISFETAILVFDDFMSVTNADPNWDEQRWRTIGMINTVMVIVIHTMPEFTEGIKPKPGRVISARKATKLERRIYEDKRK